MEDDRYAGVSNRVEHKNKKGNVTFHYQVDPKTLEEAKRRARKMDRENAFLDDDEAG